MKNQNVFIRRSGLFGGVCGGLAARLGIHVLILRIALWVSFLCTFGVTFLVYLSAVISFPSELTINFGDQPKFLGVCHKLAPKLGIHETWLRFIALVSCIFTAFIPIFAIYMILFLINIKTQSHGVDSSGVRDVN